jgi:hypothetical protein
MAFDDLPVVDFRMSRVRGWQAYDEPSTPDLVACMQSLHKK